MKHARSQAPTDVVLAGLFATPSKAKGIARDTRRGRPADEPAADHPAGSRRKPDDAREP